MSKLLRFTPALLWMILIFYLSSIHELELRGELSVYDLVLRKVAHVVEYAVLYLLLFWGLKLRLTGSTNFKISLLITILYAVTDEIHQYLVPTRDGKVVDVIIDSVGAVSAFLLIKYRHANNLRKFPSNQTVGE